MKIGIIYSSVTGNTKKIAVALHKNLNNSELIKAKNDINLNEYDILILGYWVNKGTANLKIKNLVENLSNKKIAVFGTSGQYPNSKRAIKYKKRVKKLVENENIYLGGYICQGKIKEERTKKRLEIPKGESHYLDEKGYKRHLESRNHPNMEDINAAILWIKNIIN